MKHPDRHEQQGLSQKRLTEVHRIHPHGEKRQRWTEGRRAMKESPTERRRGEQELKKRSQLLPTSKKRQYMSFLSAASVFHLNKYLVFYTKLDGHTAHLSPNTVQYVHIIIITRILLLLIITFSSPAPLPENTTMVIEVASNVFLKYPCGSHIDYLR